MYLKMEMQFPKDLLSERCFRALETDDRRNIATRRLLGNSILLVTARVYNLNSNPRYPYSIWPIGGQLENLCTRVQTLGVSAGNSSGGWNSIGPKVGQRFCRKTLRDNEKICVYVRALARKSIREVILSVTICEATSFLIKFQLAFELAKWSSLVGAFSFAFKYSRITQVEFGGFALRTVEFVEDIREQESRQEFLFTGLVLVYMCGEMYEGGLSHFWSGEKESAESAAGSTVIQYDVHARSYPATAS